MLTCTFDIMMYLCGFLRFLNHSINLDTIFENYINHGEFNRQIFEQIQTHHSDIATYKSWDDINISDKKGALQVIV